MKLGDNLEMSRLPSVWSVVYRQTFIE